jgi:hypothetical protein
MSIALALGQLEEAIGVLETDPSSYRALLQDRVTALAALYRLRTFLLQATAAEAARVAVALYTPITAKEVEEAAP